MSNMPSDQSIADLHRAIRRWKRVVLTSIAVGALSLLALGIMTGVLLVRAQRQTEAALNAEMEARRAVEQFEAQVPEARRNFEQGDGLSATRLAEGLAVLDLPVKTLLRESARNDAKHETRFFKTITALAQKHGSSLKEYLSGGSIRAVDEGYAVFFREGEQKYVVAVLRGNSHVIPGDDSQYLLLLDHEGRVLDRLTCAINNRLTRMFVDYYGVFRTEVPDAAEDGAQLIIRYIPEHGGSVAGNWSHGIAHGGKTRRYAWNQDFGGSIPPSEWDKKGLCRVAIHDGKFAVLFPKLE
jgi:hypothetical protein